MFMRQQNISLARWSAQHGQLVIAAVVAVLSLAAAAAQKKKDEKAPYDSALSDRKKQAMVTLRRELPTRSEYFAFSPRDIDVMLERELGKLGRQPAPTVDDATFIRRAHLDAIGKLPAPKAVADFIADSSPNKRAKLVDELLASKDYARNWARFWRDVVLYNTTTDDKKFSAKNLEDWLADQLDKDRGWDAIASELIIAEGKDMADRRDNFLLAQDGAATRMAAETARVFMGISVQCAECHDHPFDDWKREQFHEMAAFFSKGKYYMEDKQDPSKKIEMKPRFLLGERPPEKMSGEDKRLAVAAYLVYNPKNYWFARAYVNRVWNELLGDGFYKVDSLGPDGEVIYPSVVNRISVGFRADGFRPKWLMRTIMNTQAYQRKIGTPAAASDRFAVVRPTRLRGSQVADVLEQVLGNVKRDGRIVDQFGYDPSLPQEDVEGSIQQALLLMNNPSVHGQIGKLAPDLVKIKANDELIKQAYLRVLAREPTTLEVARVRAYFSKVSDRREATEDLLWTLVNSAEFTTKR
jgi:hypothetical protein